MGTPIQVAESSGRYRRVKVVNQYAGPNLGKVISCSLTIDKAVLQGPHRAENRGSGASALPQTAGFWSLGEG